MSLSALFSGLVGALGSSGERTLQDALQADLHPRAALLTDSGTAALALALTAAAPERDALVALPAYSCYDIATAADAANAHVVLYDVDDVTLAPEAGSLARALAHRPRAVVAVHLYGVPVDIARVQQAAADARALVIEDAAQGIGGAIRSEPAGSQGSLAILSFGRGKGISGGAGGALLANDDSGVLALEQLRSRVAPAAAGWSELARAGAQWMFARPAVYGFISALPFLRLGETIYHSPRPQRALSRAASRIVAHVWAEAHADTMARRARGARLQRAAEQSSSWRAIELPPDLTPGFLRLPLIALGARSAAITRAATQLGVMPGYPLPLSKLPGFRDRCINANDAFPGAELLSQRLITLPTHRYVSTRDLERLERWLQQPIEAG